MSSILKITVKTCKHFVEVKRNVWQNELFIAWDTVLYRIEKYVWSKCLSSILTLWLSLVLLMILVKMRSFSESSWSVSFQLSVLLPFIPQIMATALPFAVGVGIVRWRELLRRHQLFTAISSLGYAKTKMHVMSFFMALFWVAMGVGLMNYLHPLLNESSRARLIESGAYILNHVQDKTMKSFDVANNTFNLYTEKEPNHQVNFYIIWPMTNGKINFYQINDFKSDIHEENWRLSLGSGIQAFVSPDQGVNQWSAFKEHDITLPVKKETKSLQARSTSQLDLTQGAHRQEFYLRLATPLFIFLIALLRLTDLYTKPRGKSTVWLTLIFELIVLSLLFFIGLTLSDKEMITWHYYFGLVLLSFTPFLVRVR